MTSFLVPLLADGLFLAPPVAPTHWWDFSDAGKVTADGSGLVSDVASMLPGGLTLSQGTAGAKPAWGPNAGGRYRTQNGRAVLDFDGGDYVQSSTFLLLQPVTVFAVMALDSASLTQRQIVGDGLTTPTLYTDNVGGALKWSYYATTVQNSATTANTSAHQLCGVFNGASSALYLDGSSISTANPGSSGWSTKVITIGAQSSGVSPWDGWIAEVIVYGSALGTTDRQAVEAYLKKKWATP